MVYVCEWCNNIKEAPDQKPKIKLSDLTEEEYIDYICRFIPMPHYICPDCVRKVLEGTK